MHTHRQAPASYQSAHTSRERADGTGRQMCGADRRDETLEITRPWVELVIRWAKAGVNALLQHTCPSTKGRRPATTCSSAKASGPSLLGVDNDNASMGGRMRGSN